MEIARLMENKPTEKIYGIVGNINLTTNNSNYAITNDYHFKETVEKYLDSKKAESSLNIVMLSKEYLQKKSSELSEAELKSISLAKALIDNKEFLVFDYFEKGLNHKEKENFKRLWKKLSREYHKTIIIFTNDISFLWSIADSIIAFDEKERITIVPKEKYFSLATLTNKPEIVKFIELMRAKNIQIEDYQNTLDLLKAIYRLKGE